MPSYLRHQAHSSYDITIYTLPLLDWRQKLIDTDEYICTVVYPAHASLVNDVTLGTDQSLKVRTGHAHSFEKYGRLVVDHENGATPQL